MTDNVAAFDVFMDKDLKLQADLLFEDLGMDWNTAINVFVRQAVRQGNIPFKIAANYPNPETIEALLEAERLTFDPNVKGYDNVEDALRELKA